MTHSAKILADSMSPDGVRLTTMEVTFPRIVLAEFNTHRVLCLAGDSELEFDLPAGQTRGGKRVYKMRIDQFVDRWHNGAAPRPNKGGTGFNRQPMQEKLAAMQIRQLNERTGLVQTSTVLDCMFSGIKRVFEVTAGRFKVAGSKEHRVLTFDGWKSIGELTVGDLLVVRRFGKKEEDFLDPMRHKKFGDRWRSVWQREERAKRIEEFGGCEQCGSQNQLQIHHIEPVYKAPEKAFETSNVVLLCGECHEAAHETQGWQGDTYLYGDTEPVTGVRLRGVEPTFDLAIAGEFPNFVANGVVVHNSRNSASSRAIPVEKMIRMVQEHPYVPTHWGKNQKGMQADEELADYEQRAARAVWNVEMQQAVSQARELVEIGVHKQITNRLLEPFMWHTVIVTATEWDNFFHLRCHPAAHPEIRRAAELMHEVMRQSQPERVDNGQWHLPLWGTDEDLEDGPSLEDIKKISVARCARVSYLTHEGKRSPLADVELCDRLLASGHMSPFEHVARPMHVSDYRWVHRSDAGTPLVGASFCGNFRGWVQYRKTIPHEHDILGAR